MPLEIRSLDPACKTSFFRCGNAEIDGWFNGGCRKRHADHLARTYTAHRDNNLPIGFYSLVLATEDRDQLPKKEQSQAWVYLGFLAFRIHYFAVQKQLQKQGIGRALMGHALEQAYAIAKAAGVYAVTLIAQDESAERFYKKLGFETYGTLQGKPQMKLPLSVVIDLFEGEE